MSDLPDAPVPQGEVTAPAVEDEGKRTLPTVSGAGPGEWYDQLVRSLVQLCAGGLSADDADTPEARNRVSAGLDIMAGIAPGDVLEDIRQVVVRA